MKRTLLASLLLCACATPPSSEAIDEIALRDPAFGGREFLEFHFANRRDLIWQREDQLGERLQVLRDYAESEHANACQRVRDVVDDAQFAADVLAYLRTPAGCAEMNAEFHVLTGFPQGASMFAEGQERLRDPARVGEAARKRMFEVQFSAQDSSDASLSPYVLSWVLGATHVEPEQANEIAQFYATGVGKRWLALRSEALIRSSRAQRAFVETLRDDGWATSIYDSLDLFLPRAEFDDDGGK